MTDGPVAWGAFAASAPELAASGRRLLVQFGPGLGFLATVGRDGSPRLHPVTLAVADAELYVFVAPGPKQRDLVRDGRYALHAFLPDEVEEEFMVAGVAELADPSERDTALAAYHQPAVPDDHRLFRLRIARALHAAYRFRGDWPPAYTRWRSGDGTS